MCIRFEHCADNYSLVMAHLWLSIVWSCDFNISPFNLESSPRVSRDMGSG